jgi:hypothetical protein
MRRLLAVGAALLVALGLGVAPAAAAEVTFEEPTAEATFGTEIVFRQAFTSPDPLARVELLLEFPGSLGPLVVEVAGSMPAGRQALEHRWVLEEDGHLVPNTPITARWRVIPADRSRPPTVGPAVGVVYSDTRFAWRTLAGDLVSIHWYEGSDAFGRRALRIAETAVEEAAAFMGVTETEPIDFFVYADEDAFYDALGPGTRENVGGQAHSDIRTMFALIGPGDVTDPWVAIVIPHELTHLVFDTAVSNPYHFPPRWLNEGVATYLSEGYTTSDRSAVQSAAADGRLMPLEALTGQFPTTAERFYLAYAESVSAVDFLVREEGTDALVELIGSYADGVTDDEAFQAAIGRDVAAFEAAWLADLGAAPPTRYGPQPAPAGPLPPGWEDGATPPGDGAGATTSPAPSPSASAPAGPGDGGTTGGSSPLGQGGLLALAAVAGVAVGASIGLVRRRRARERPPATGGQGPGPGGDGTP